VPNGHGIGCLGEKIRTETGIIISLTETANFWLGERAFNVLYSWARKGLRVVITNRLAHAIGNTLEEECTRWLVRPV